MPLRLRRGEGEVDESAELGPSPAARHLRLGDLLWDAQRPAAAAVEYGRAHEIEPDDPIVASRYARAALTGANPQGAATALARFRERYPDHAPTWAISGAAWLALGDLRHARTALREAIRINPFDPDPHCDLAEATDRAGERERAREACSLLGGRRTPR
jgi:Flp pilus assembly protein TadD